MSNLSKGPFKGKGEDLDREARAIRIGKLSQELYRVRMGMGTLMQEINGARGIRREGYFRARLHRVGGRFAVRMEWNDGRSSFQLVSERGLRLLRALDPVSQEALIGFERRREWLNHQYRVLFAERRSLRQLHKFDEGIGKLIAGLDLSINQQPEQGS